VGGGGGGGGRGAGRTGGGAATVSPVTAPRNASSTPAVSRTLRDTHSSLVSSDKIGELSGPSDVRPRDGFSPTRPQQLAGMRIEPPPSLACATGTIPLATAAAEPPLEPPVVRVTSQGLRVGPCASGSVVGTRPNSGVFVRPRHTNPASRYFCARLSVCVDFQFAAFRKPAPQWYGSSFTAHKRSLNSVGTPRNGPSGSGPRASVRARSNRS
jgi:hypothetical protein